MDHKTVEEYILSMPNARLDYPFGKDVAVYKVFVPASGSHRDAAQGDRKIQNEPYRSTVNDEAQQVNAAMRPDDRQSSGLARGMPDQMRGEWKMFALIQEGKDPVRISLKCDPQLAEVLREKYDSIMPGYHLNKKHWNTIILAGQLPWEEIQGFIRHSYDLVARD